jgi:predicted transcriptional regulator
MQPLPRELVRAIYLNRDLHRQVAVLAATEDRPIRALVEEAVTEYLSDKQVLVTALPRVVTDKTER